MLDRWILSELAITVRDVRSHLDRYHVYEAAQKLTDFTESLSNWYVRRCRDRFWAPKEADGSLGRDKRDAYWTLYEALVTVTLVAAPFLPFLSEDVYQNLVRGPFPERFESVHLERMPEPDLAVIDEKLAEEMAAVRELVSLGLQVRTASKLRVRQPLRQADVIVAKDDLRARLANDAYRALIREELNINELQLLRTGEEVDKVRYRLKPNFRALGPKLGKKVQLAKKVLEGVDAAKLRIELSMRGSVAVDLDGEKVEIGPEEIEVAIEAKEGFAAAGSRAGVVILYTQLDDALIDQGLARELLSRVQGLRKELALGYSDRIRLAVSGSERIVRVCRAFAELIAAEALIEGGIGMEAPDFAPLASRDLEVGTERLHLDLGVVKTA